MSKECADCGNERIMLCPFCEHDFSEASKQKDAELATLREAVEVLGREVGEWRWMDEHWQTAPTQKYLERQRALLSACHKTDANPTARAAVEDKG